MISDISKSNQGTKNNIRYVNTYKHVEEHFTPFLKRCPL